MTTCNVSYCKRTNDHMGYCNMHYQRWYRSGDPIGQDGDIEALHTNGIHNETGKKLLTIVNSGKVRDHFKKKTVLMRDVIDIAEREGSENVIILRKQDQEDVTFKTLFKSIFCKHQNDVDFIKDLLHLYIGSESESESEEE